MLRLDFDSGTFPAKERSGFAQGGAMKQMLGRIRQASEKMRMNRTYKAVTEFNSYEIA
jgi:hypothetical protein